MHKLQLLTLYERDVYMRKKMLFTIGLSSLFIGQGVIVNAQTDTGLIKENIPSTKVEDKQDAKKALKELPASKNIKKNYSDYSVEKVEKDKQGFTHYTLYPKFNNKLATDQEVKVHVNPQGKIVLINGELDAKNMKPSNSVKISKDEALNQAFKAINIQRSEADFGKDNVVKSSSIVIDGKTQENAYEFEIATLKPKTSNWKVRVDTETGKIIQKEDLTQRAATIGEGKGVLNDRKKININSINDGFSLEDLTHKGKLSAYELIQSTGNTKLFTDKDKVFEANQQKAAVDANFYGAKVYDYYKKTFGRESYDDKGSPINSIVHVNNFQGEDNRNNAAWIGDKMIYGDGDGQTFVELSGADDIVAHEITHGITQETANLKYQGQSGALNESFSDVFGYFVDSDDWLMGEDVYTPNRKGDALRSMSNPTQYNQPEHMNNYVQTSQDNGGVHTNSGIPNKAAYLTIKKLGKSKSEQVYYRALTQYLTSNSNFKDARNALVQSAIDLYGLEDSKKVASSWQQVGIN